MSNALRPNGNIEKKITTAVLICEKHGEYTAETTSTTYTPGGQPQVWTSRCPVCDKELTERRERADAENLESRRRELVARNRNKSNIPLRFAGSTFENYNAITDKQKNALATARSFAENFAEIRKAGGNLTLCGAVGCGKTHLACAVANHLLEDGATAIYTRVLDMVRSIRETWRDHGKNETEVINRYVNTGLLIVDEIGVQFGSEAEQNQVFDVLDGRYSNMRPTLIISNLGKRGLQECLGDRAFDRLFDISSLVVVFDWESYRLSCHEPSGFPAEASR